MTTYSNALLAATGLSGTLDGDWFNPPAGVAEYLAVQLSLTAGTATVVIEGRVSDQDAPVELTTFSATDGAAVLAFPQLRARVSASAGATLRVAIGVTARKP